MPLSLSKVQACATCLKTELEVEIKHCTRCNIITYCSKDCQTEDWKNHKGHCQDISQGGPNKIEAILEIAFLHNNYEAQWIILPISSENDRISI